MIRRRQLLKAAVLVSVGLLPQSSGAATVGIRPFSARIIQSGHSLTDPIVPILDGMVEEIGGSHARGRLVDRSTIPGSPMDWRWNNRNSYMPDARYDIGNYDVLVITERSSLSNTMPWHDSERMALRWFVHAWSNGRAGAGAETILYATWVNIDSGPSVVNTYNDPEGHMMFRERLPLEMARWQAIAEYVNFHRPVGSPKMRVIPGPLLMAAVYDAIVEGQAPGLYAIDDLFVDSIHLNAVGSYLIALSHLAVIYGQDPRALAVPAHGEDPPSPATAQWLAQLVHDVLLNYPDADYPRNS
jgi:hypothetical protein